MNCRDLIPGPRHAAIALIRAASFIVPSPLRAEWRREWISELHHARREMLERGDRATGPKLLEFARGAFHDAAWYRLRDWNAGQNERAVSRQFQSAGFCLAALAALIIVIAAASGFLPETRAVLLPLPYANAGRIATVAQGGSTLAVRSGIRKDWVDWWRSDSRLIDDAATYVWSEQSVTGTPTLRARVSENFFRLLGTRSEDGRNIESRDGAYLSYDFAHSHWGNRPPASIEVDGKPVRVAGVLDRRFWFITRRIGVWVIDTNAAPPPARTGVVVRLRNDVSRKQAESELESIAKAHGVNAWSSLVEVSPLGSRVRSVLASFALALLLAVGTVLPALRPSFLSLEMSNWRAAASVSGFFFAKTTLALIAVLLAGLEFTRAASITMLGGTDLSTEPLSTWLFLLGCMGALTWSIYDQRRRCRVCLWRYGLAAQIGCPGCVLFGWAGTELVCLEGHGTLHVTERAWSFQEKERWTTLDDSVMELFASSE